MSEYKLGEELIKRFSLPKLSPPERDLSDLVVINEKIVNMTHLEILTKIGSFGDYAVIETEMGPRYVCTLENNLGALVLSKEEISKRLNGTSEVWVASDGSMSVPLTDKFCKETNLRLELNDYSGSTMSEAEYSGDCKLLLYVMN